ncbi:putative 3-hydroxyisobutyrate dehydrogenase [Colletotrichum gloeosporioides]|uniref:3-hydroxyisobutyrate dehydrogenase n=1 Tax=Colletotrichum gloeosporioides TaxID=474922 RepID=A0A8H4CTX4_COLGL|nr:putative 3-hydroxyisobutyrate dehydrogenase [Colletotrichum gloeosporioides]KAF3809917.1 putative 3-hydroxyisobutyrate dehydrogenase [Colletotrichum gloeosporioides]
MVSGLKLSLLLEKSLKLLQDVIMTSVPQALHVQDVFLHPDHGLLSAKKRPNREILFLELSTIDPKASREVADAINVGEWGKFVDAPCSGGAMGAERGSLSFMVGCSDELYPRVFEICKLMGSEDGIFHCGELGSGLQIKLLNNYLSALTAMATAETYNIGLRGGLDARKLDRVINASSGMNFNSKINNPVPGLTPANAASHGYVGGFSIELCLGVLELGFKTAEDVGAKTVLGKPMLKAYRDAASYEEFQGKDSKVIYKWLGGESPDLS